MGFVEMKKENELWVVNQINLSTNVMLTEILCLKTDEEKNVKNVE